MDRKAAKTTCNMNHAFGPGLLMNVQCSSGSRSLQRRWEPWRWGAQWTAIGSWQVPSESIIKADPLTTAQEAAEELNVNHSLVVRHLEQIGKVKKLDEWVPHELIANQKNHHFEVSSSLSLCNNNEPFLDRIVTCDETWVLYDTGDHQLSGGAEKKL